MKNYGNAFDIKTFLNKDKPVYVINYRHPNQATLQETLEEHHENFMRIKDMVENSNGVCLMDKTTGPALFFFINDKLLFL